MRDANQEIRRHLASRRAGAVFLFAWLLILFGLWLWLVDTLSLPELLVGPVAALISAAVTLGVRNKSGARFLLRPRWLRWFAHLPLGVLRDSAVVLAALWRHLARRERVPGVFRVVECPLTGDDPQSASRRALATALTSVTPNTYVIGIDRERGVVLIHQLVPDAPEKLRQTLASSGLGGA